MAHADCHAPKDSPRERARTLILKGLGAKRVAAWCGVGEATVYQWLSRGTDAEPVPSARLPDIIRGATAAGLEAPIEVLWPALHSASPGTQL